MLDEIWNIQKKRILQTSILPAHVCAQMHVNLSWGSEGFLSVCGYCYESLRSGLLFLRRY